MNACAATSYTKNVNTRVYDLILYWQKKIFFHKYIKRNDELKDGALLFHRIKIILISSYQENLWVHAKE